MDYVRSATMVVDDCIGEDNWCRELDRGRLIGSGYVAVDFSVTAQSGWIWTSFVFFAPLCIFGLVGNILTIIMFSFYIKKTTTSVFILGLAAVDLLVCTTSMPIWLHTLLTREGGYDSDAMCKVNKFSTFIAVPLSAAILLAIAIDRFILIFLVKMDVITRFRAKIILASIALVCLGAAITQPMTFTTSFRSQATNVSTYNSLLITLSSKCNNLLECRSKMCVQTDRYLPGESSNYYIWMALMYMYICMVFAFVLLYLLIFLKVYTMHKKMNSWRRRSPSSKTDMVNLSRFSSSAQSPLTNNASGGALANIQSPEAVRMSANLSLHEMSDSVSDEFSLSKPREDSRPQQTSGRTLRIRKKKLPHLHTAITLCLVTASFVFAYAPMILMMFVKSCAGTDRRAHKSVLSCGRNTAKHFFWNFYYINHVTNPVIYAYMNPRFKEGLSQFGRRILSVLHLNSKFSAMTNPSSSKTGSTSLPPSSPDRNDVQL